MEIGKQIQNIRKEHHLSQEQFGKMFHVTRQTVSNWENEKSFPDLQTLVAISNFSHVPLDTLLKKNAKMVEDFDSAIASARRTKRTIIILISIIVLTPILWFAIFLIRLNIALRPTPYAERNVSETDAIMYVNLPGQTPSDAIIRTYSKEDYDSFSQRKKSRIYDKVGGNMEGDVPPLFINEGETIAHFTFQNGTSHDMTPKKPPTIRIREHVGVLPDNSQRVLVHEDTLSKDADGYYYDFSGFHPIDSSEYPSVTLEITYSYGEEETSQAVSVTALNLIRDSF